MIDDGMTMHEAFLSGCFHLIQHEKSVIVRYFWHRNQPSAIISFEFYSSKIWIFIESIHWCWNQRSLNPVNYQGNLISMKHEDAGIFIVYGHVDRKNNIFRENWAEQTFPESPHFNIQNETKQTKKTYRWLTIDGNGLVFI